jgi:hypothetical protein
MLSTVESVLMRSGPDERAAFRATRTDELHSDPKEFASAASDWSEEVVADFVVALTSRDRHGTAGDNMILQHQAAIAVIDGWVDRIVKAEERLRFDI